MKNLPQKQNGAKRNDLASDSQAMTDRLAKMRKAIGITESRVLHYTCSATGKDFAATFRRLTPSHRFQIETIEAIASESQTWLGKLFGTNAPEGQSFASSEFDFAGFACPYCGHRGNRDLPDFFQCACHRLLCGARVTALNGTMRYACFDACGGTGMLGGQIASFEGSEAAGAAKHTALDKTKRLSAPLKKLPRK